MTSLWASRPLSLSHFRDFRTGRAFATASTSNLYPYPSGPRPNPHQIFHLSPGASQQEIKARYYDLVRIHHPDSPSCRHLSAAQRHARFQSITSAYDSLRGHRSSPASSWHSGVDEELERRRNYQNHRRRARSAGEFDPYAGPNGREWTASADDRWKDRMIMIIGGVSLAVALTPMFFANPFVVGEQRHRLAAANLAEARQEAQEVGQERRREIRRRVEAHRQRVLDEHLAEPKREGDGP